MSATTQTLIAFLLVLGAAVSLLLRWRAQRAKAGCGGDCGCEATPLRNRVRSLDR